jgi:hypothetical protein
MGRYSNRKRDTARRAPPTASGRSTASGTASVAVPPFWIAYACIVLLTPIRYATFTTRYAAISIAPARLATLKNPSLSAVPIGSDIVVVVQRRG